MNIDDLHAEGYSFTLADFNEVLIKEWQNTAFDFYEGSMFDLVPEYHTNTVFLIPGNSFGLMREGNELLALQYYGKEVERKIQSVIKQEPHKELLVGNSCGAMTTKGNVIYSPINRVPGRISEPTNVYLAFRSGVASAVESGYKKLIFPGFGTGLTYMMKEDWVVRMMSLAIEDVFNQKAFPSTIDEAIALHTQGYPK